jgi:hypothetical protein
MYRLQAAVLRGLLPHLVHGHLGRLDYSSSSASRQEACLSLREQLTESTAVMIQALD